MTRSPLHKAIEGPSDGGADSTASDETASDTSSSRPTAVRGVQSGTPFVNTRVGGKPTSVFKQEVDRRSTLNPSIRRAVERSGGLPKPYDPVLLRDVSAHAVTQAYIDTLAQDVAAADWSIEPRDADATPDDGVIEDTERAIEQIHPEKSFPDILEQTTRNLLELGDSTWIKHYYENTDELAEVVPVDSARMFKSVNEWGITDGYIQASFSQLDVSQLFGLQEVVWFEWASRTDHQYGMGPTEKGLDVIMLLEELSEKEKKDLIEGMPSGIVTAKEDPDNPLDLDEFENVKREFQMEEGERHRVLVSRGDWDFTNFSGNYQELEIIKRNKYWVTVLGAVYKVNPSYAGFDFENTNRATDESQQEAFRQRGFRQTLRQVEEAINLQLIYEDFSEEIRFTFQREQTVDERSSKVGLLRDAADATEQWASMGRPVDVDSDGTIHVEPGEVTEDDIDDPADAAPGGGLFASTDANSRENAQTDDDTGDISRSASAQRASKAELERAEDLLLDAYKTQIWPESLEAIEKRSFRDVDDVPAFVKEMISDAIDAGAIFDGIKSLPDGVRETLGDVIGDQLTQPQGWSLDSVTDAITSEFPAVDAEDAEVVARTETASVLNQAREMGYEERDESGRFRFYWQGPDDQRTTDACTELKEETNPQYGGTPVTLNDLKRREKQLQQQHFPSLSQFRDHTIHPNERHTFVRHVDVPDL